MRNGFWFQSFFCALYYISIDQRGVPFSRYFLIIWSSIFVLHLFCQHFLHTWLYLIFYSCKNEKENLFHLHDFFFCKFPTLIRVALLLSYKKNRVGCVLQCFSLFLCEFLWFLRLNFCYFQKLLVGREMKEIGACCVCSDEQGWKENPLAFCTGCTVTVHQGIIS